jgi:hypothetical protein
MACTDKSLTYLNGLGYNVVRHPNAAIKPLDLIGVQGGEPRHLGPLHMLLTAPPESQPAVQTDIAAADINGQVSSTLDLGIGISVLGNLIGAMGGGNLGASLSYTNAKQMNFSYTEVFNDTVEPLQVGKYLRDGQVDSRNLILEQYVLGNGQLYVITKTAKTHKFNAKYEISNGLDASVKVPVLQQVAGGDIKVSATSGQTSTVTFEGRQRLIFAFQCFEVGVLDGILALTTQAADGGVYLAVGSPEANKSKGKLLKPTGLVSVQF